MERQEALTRTATWMDLESILLGDGGQTQKCTRCVVPFPRNVPEGRSIVGTWLSGCRGLGGRTGWRMRANRHGVSF